MTFDVNRFRVKFRGRLNQPHTLTGWTRSRRGEEEPREKNKHEEQKKRKKRESIGDMLSQGHQYLLHLREREMLGWAAVRRSRFVCGHKRAIQYSNNRDQTLTERRSHEIARVRKSVHGRAFLGSGIAWLVGFALCPVGGDATRDEV